MCGVTKQVLSLVMHLVDDEMEAYAPHGYLLSLRPSAPLYEVYELVILSAATEKLRGAGGGRRGGA